jgi:hypothetical protein
MFSLTITIRPDEEGFAESGLLLDVLGNTFFVLVCVRQHLAWAAR